MFPLVRHLAPRHRNDAVVVGSGDLPGIEGVAASRRLVSDRAQVCCDGARGRRGAAKAIELRVGYVAGRPPAQDGLREEPFPPECDEPASIQELRVKAPETHATRVISLPSPARAVKFDPPRVSPGLPTLGGLRRPRDQSAPPRPARV